MPRQPTRRTLCSVGNKISGIKLKIFPAKLQTSKETWAKTNLIAENVATGPNCNNMRILIEDSKCDWTMVLSWNQAN